MTKPCWVALLTLLTALANAQAEEKPLTWIYTDMSDPTLPGTNHRGTINDPDDVSAMAGYLLMANEFETLGIVVASTHRKEHAATPDQGEWARLTFATAYAADRPRLERAFGGYPEALRIIESGIKKTAELFDPARDYASLENYPTVTALLDALVATDRTINVLCWGSVTEPAILVRHLQTTGRKDLLGRLRFIAHWTSSSFHQGTVEHPERVANCAEDAEACAFLKRVAAAGEIRYHECGAIGQHGIVSGGPKGEEYFGRFKSSELGRLFAEGKFVHDGVDHSDSATYWTLLGTWGVGLDDIASDGTNPPETEKRNENTFRENSRRLHDELLRRAEAAASGD